MGLRVPIERPRMFDNLCRWRRPVTAGRQSKALPNVHLRRECPLKYAAAYSNYFAPESSLGFTFNQRTAISADADFTDIAAEHHHDYHLVRPREPRRSNALSHFDSWSSIRLFDKCVFFGQSANANEGTHG